VIRSIGFYGVLTQIKTDFVLRYFGEMLFLFICGSPYVPVCLSHIQTCLKDASHKTEFLSFVIYFNKLKSLKSVNMTQE
jgi:hypothetical protein